MDRDDPRFRSWATSEATAFVSTCQASWAAVPERLVTREIRSWLRDRGLQGVFTAWVDVASEHRYRLVPEWDLQAWLRYARGVYEIPVEE